MATRKITLKSPARIAAGDLTLAERKARNKETHRRLVAELPRVGRQSHKSNPIVHEQKQSGLHPLMLDKSQWDKTKVMEIVCNRIAASTRSMISILKQSYVDDDGKEWAMPNFMTIQNWLISDPEVNAAYAHAKLRQTEIMGEEILDISDSGLNDTYVDEKTGRTFTNQDVIARSRLRVDTRKWLMAKLNPRRYGETLKLQGDPDAPFTHRIIPEGTIKSLTTEELRAMLARAEDGQ